MHQLSKKNHYRQRSFTSKHEHRKEHAIQHHQYLISLNKNKHLFPRYE